MKATAQTTSNDQTSSGEPRRRDVYLTLVNLGCVYFLISVSYSGLETLQSTVNAHEGLGTTSIGVLYASLIASSLLFGPTVVDRLRAKKTLYVFWTANAVFAVANAFPRWETLVPASAFVGVTMASGNIVYGLYVTGLAAQLDPTNGQLAGSFNIIVIVTPLQNDLLPGTRLSSRLPVQSWTEAGIRGTEVSGRDPPSEILVKRVTPQDHIGVARIFSGAVHFS